MLRLLISARLIYFSSADNFHLAGDVSEEQTEFQINAVTMPGLLPFWSSFPPSGFDEWSIQYFFHSPVLLRSKVGVMILKKKWRVDFIFTSIIMARIVLMLPVCNV